MLPSIANLVAAESHNNNYSCTADRVYSSSSSSSPWWGSPLLRHYYLHHGFVRESPSATSSPSSPSFSCSYDASTPSSPDASDLTTFATTSSTGKSSRRKASLSFILNHPESSSSSSSSSSSDDDLAASTTTTTSNKRKRSSGSDQRAVLPSKEPMRTMTPTPSMALEVQFTDDQQATLEAMFERDPLPGARAKVQHADQLGVPLKNVQWWFQNHRSKLRKRGERKRLLATLKTAGGKPRYVFHNLRAKAQANGVLQRFVVDKYYG